MQDCLNLIHNRGSVVDVQYIYYRLPLAEQKQIKTNLMQTKAGREFLKYLPLTKAEQTTLSTY